MATKTPRTNWRTWFHGGVNWYLDHARSPHLLHVECLGDHMRLEAGSTEPVTLAVPSELSGLTMILTRYVRNRDF
jgi:hypothetical protein